MADSQLIALLSSGRSFALALPEDVEVYTAFEYLTRAREDIRGGKALPELSAEWLEVVPDS